MNAYLSKEVRKKYRATWQEEFIVGMVAYLGPMNSKRVLLETGYEGAMSPATAQKYLQKAVKNKLLVMTRSKDDRRSKDIDCTERGFSFLNEVKHSQLK